MGLLVKNHLLQTMSTSTPRKRPPPPSGRKKAPPRNQLHSSLIGADDDVDEWSNKQGWNKNANTPQISVANAIISPTRNRRFGYPTSPPPSNEKIRAQSLSPTAIKKDKKQKKKSKKKKKRGRTNTQKKKKKKKKKS